MLPRLARMATVAALVLAVAPPLAHAATPTAFVYATDSNAKLPQYSADDAGRLTPLVPALEPGVATSTGIATSPDGRTLYVVDQTASDVSQYAIGDDGSLTPKTPATVATGPTGSAPFGIAIASDGRHAYVTNQVAGNIAVFDVGSDGALQPNPATVSSGAGTVGIALSLDGASAYATNSTAGTISQYDIDPADGSLRPKSTATVAAGSAAFGIAVSTDGQSVYATNRTATGLVRQYSVGPGGALTPMAVPTVTVGSRPAGILATAHGVYVSNFASDSVSQLDADAGGALTPSAADIGGPHNPFGLTLSPDGHSLYVAGFGDGKIAQYDVADDGALAAKDPLLVDADVRPVAIAAVKAPDTQAPTVDLRTPADGAHYAAGADVDADYSCADAGGSGLASCEGDVASGEPLRTSEPGTFDFTVVARDGAGHETTVTHSYTVDAPPEPGFEGFVGSIHDGSVVRAGSAVPIAFSLRGFHGLHVLADGSPSSARVDCDDPSEQLGDEAPAASADGLLFDEASGTYTFAWQTDRAWAYTCRAFTVTLRDGSAHQLVVRFCPPRRYHRWYRHW
jgi:6-phosphogluconolactonase (cycloisomerase 2 family)